MDDLAYFLFWANALSAGIVCLDSFLRRGGYLTLPFLTSLIFLTWYLPQAWVLLDDASIRAESIARLLLISLLSFWAMIFGWHRGIRKAVIQPTNLDVPVGRLVLPVLIISVFAWAMNILIEAQPDEARASGQWTGILTIIYFFSTVGVVSMALSTAMVMRRRSIATISLFAMNVALYVPKILIYFRRADTFEFIFALFLALLFVRRWSVPKSVLLVSAIVGFFFINGVGHLRNLAGGYQLSSNDRIETRIPTFSEIASIDWLSVAEQKDRKEISEVRNAVMFLEVVEQEGTFTYGAQFWNKLVFSYVPGQLIGYDTKQRLMIGTSVSELALSELNYKPHTGTTSTGFVDPYRDFWLFGTLVWWLSGFAMARTMYFALHGGLIAYILYASTITNAVQITTHFGYYLFSQSVLIGLVIYGLKLWLYGWRKPKSNYQSSPRKVRIGSPGF